MHKQKYTDDKSRTKRRNEERHRVYTKLHNTKIKIKGNEIKRRLNTYFIMKTYKKVFT